MRSIKNMRAFTLIEMVIVLVLLGILAGLAIPTFQSLVTESNAKANRLGAEAVVTNAQALSALEDGNQDLQNRHMTTSAEEAGVAYGTESAGNVAADGTLTVGGTPFTIGATGIVE